jgi:hypothetical protein
MPTWTQLSQVPAVVISSSPKGGTNAVTEPETVPIVTFAPATRADLTSGKKVLVVATPARQGVFEAHLALVEKDGVEPLL